MALPLRSRALEPDAESQPLPFNVSVDLVAGSVAVSGELDRQNARYVLDGLALLAPTQHTRWSIETGQVTFCDAAGLRVLVSGHHLARRHGSRLVVDRPSRCVLRLLLLVGLEGVLTVETDLPRPSPAAGGQRPLPSSGPLRSARRIQPMPNGTGWPGR